MGKYNELIKELQGLKILQQSGDWAECLPHDIWSKHFANNFKELAHGIALDQRRHYETSISVIEIYGNPLGIRHITNLYSESSEYEDCYVYLEFIEMKEVSVVSYVPV